MLVKQTREDKHTQFTKYNCSHVLVLQLDMFYSYNLLHIAAYFVSVVWNPSAGIMIPHPHKSYILYTI